MKKEGSDLKIMEEMERKKLQDRYIRFDWAIKRLLRQKANFDVLDLLRQLRRDYPEAKIVGHCQLSPYIRKACPCFDAREEYAGLEEEVSRK